MTSKERELQKKAKEFLKKKQEKQEVFGVFFSCILFKSLRLSMSFLSQIAQIAIWRIAITGHREF